MNHSRTTLLNLALTCALALGWTAMGRAQMMGRPDQPDMPLDAATRTQVIDGALAVLQQYYIFPETAEKMEKAVKSKLQHGDYSSIASSAALAESLTSNLQAVSHDKHLRLRYSHDVLPADVQHDAAPTPEQRARQREFDRLRNFGFERVERLRGNIGYLNLRGFIDPLEGGETAVAAMNLLSNTDALIIDLRQNGGGAGEMVQLLCTYLFDGTEPVHLTDIYSRVDNRTDQYWILPHVPGPRYAGKDVYVLTSRFTFSAAEEFCYDLQNLKRVTLVGETTGGGAHPVDFRRVNDHFSVSVPYARAVNPVSHTNWEGVGVKPDVAVPAEEALKTAHVMALKKVMEKRTDPQDKDALAAAIKEIDGGGESSSPLYHAAMAH